MEKFEESYQGALKSFVLILAKMQLSNRVMTKEVIEDYYKNVDMEVFMIN